MRSIVPLTHRPTNVGQHTAREQMCGRPDDGSDAADEERPRPDTVRLLRLTAPAVVRRGELERAEASHRHNRDEANEQGAANDGIVTHETTVDHGEE